MGGVRCLGLSPKKIVFFGPLPLLAEYYFLDMSWPSLMQTFNWNFLLGIHNEDNAEDDVRAKDKEESAALTNTILTLRI